MRNPCDMLQHAATHCSTHQHQKRWKSCSKCEIHATCCNTLQHAATRCSTHQHAATHVSQGPIHLEGFFIYHTATHCNTLQHTATLWNTLHHTAPHWNTLKHTEGTRYQNRMLNEPLHVHMEGIYLQYAAHIAKYYNTMQNITTHCNALQHTRDWNRILMETSTQYTSTNWNTPQHRRDQNHVLHETVYIHRHLQGPTCNTLQHTSIQCNTL